MLGKLLMSLKKLSLYLNPILYTVQVPAGMERPSNQKIGQIATHSAHSSTQGLYLVKTGLDKNSMEICMLPDCVIFMPVGNFLGLY